MSSRLQRLLKLDAYLLGSKYPSFTQLCRALDASPRTIYSDLRDLRDRFGRDIKFCKKNRGYYNAKATTPLPSLSASDEDIALLLAAVETFSQLTGPRVKAKLISALAQLCGDRLAPLSQEVSESITVSPVKGSDLDKRFMYVLSALVSKQHLPVNDVQEGNIELAPPFTINWDGDQWLVTGQHRDLRLQVPLHEVGLRTSSKKNDCVQQQTPGQ